MMSARYVHRLSSPIWSLISRISPTASNCINYAETVIATFITLVASTKIYTPTFSFDDLRMASIMMPMVWHGFYIQRFSLSLYVHTLIATSDMLPSGWWLRIPFLRRYSFLRLKEPSFAIQMKTMPTLSSHEQSTSNLRKQTTIIREKS